MRRILATLLVLACSTPAFAAEHGAAKAEGAKDGEGGAPGTNVDMPYLMAPLQTAEGKLSGYAYIASRLTGSSTATTTEIREKIAFIQDAMLRDVNASVITMPGDPATVNNAALQARLLADARRVMGAGKVVSLTLVQVQIAPLRPSASPSVPPPAPVSPPANDSHAPAAAAPPAHH